MTASSSPTARVRAAIDADTSGCTCTPGPAFEGPCAWCDIHGQPSVAWTHSHRTPAEVSR